VSDRARRPTHGWPDWPGPTSARYGPPARHGPTLARLDQHEPDQTGRPRSALPLSLTPRIWPGSVRPGWPGLGSSLSGWPPFLIAHPVPADHSQHDSLGRRTRETSPTARCWHAPTARTFTCSHALTACTRTRFHCSTRALTHTRPPSPLRREWGGTTPSAQAGPRFPDACPGGGLGWCNPSDDAVPGSDFWARLAWRLHKLSVSAWPTRTRLRALDIFAGSRK
jgi:hypothetical protein